MISGPVFPRNGEGLSELVDSHLDEIEHGMVLVERDLEFSPDCRVDALAKDAAGRPVFLFFAQQDAEALLPGRILTASAWLVSGMPLLRSFVTHDGLEYGEAPRMIVLGFDLHASVLQQLGQLREVGVEVYQYCSVRVSGSERGGVFPVLGACALGEDGPRQLPDGVRDPQARTLGGRFLDLMRRLDPDVQVTGDRYSRTFSYGTDVLAELSLRDGHLCVRVPEVPESDLRTQEDGQAIAEAVTRRFLALDGMNSPEPDPKRTLATSSVVRSAGRPDLSLERLRDVADSAQLSPEEYSVLGESGPDD